MNVDGLEPRVEILLVEDNPGDVDLVTEYFETSEINNHLFVAGNGDEALDILYGRGRFSTRTRPHIVVLDLNLPGLNGLEVLTAIKQDPDLKSIPVIIFSASENITDIMKSYENHANCYITKPMDFDEYSRVFRSIEMFWLHTVKLPGSEHDDTGTH